KILRRDSHDRLVLRRRCSWRPARGRLCVIPQSLALDDGPRAFEVLLGDDHQVAANARLAAGAGESPEYGPPEWRRPIRLPADSTRRGTTSSGLGCERARGAFRWNTARLAA